MYLPCWDISSSTLTQGKESDTVLTATSYFDPMWNSFSKHTDGSMQWIPKQIVAIGEDFHSQVGEDKVRTTLVRTQMVESMYEYFDSGLSESHRAKLYICTLLDPRFKIYNMWPTRKYVTYHSYAQRVCSVAKLNDRG